MPAKRRAVAHDDVITHRTVVSNMGMRKQSAIVADFRSRLRFSTTVNRYEFADHIAIPDLGVGHRI